MAQPRFGAEFFVSPCGEITRKAKPLDYDQRRKIYDRDGSVCQSCGKQVKFGGINVSPYERIASGHIDHIFPRSRGGQNDELNLRLVCMSCNMRKGAKDAVA